MQQVSAGRSLAVLDPRTGRRDFDIAVADLAVVTATAARLRKAQKAWAAIGIDARIAVMSRWAEQIAGPFRQAIIDADSRDTGYGEISRIAPDMMLGFLRGSLASAKPLIAAAYREGVSRSDPNISYRTMLKPYPLVGVISPWNAPTMLSMLRAIPPLFAGCAVLVKPSEVTPRFAGAVRASIEAVPELAGVFDFVYGDSETGQALIQNADYISFTGSVPNGRRVAEACARRLIPCDVELGGKDPLVILASANLDDAVSAALRGAVTSTGQVCFSIERIYVDARLHDDFVARLAERAAKIRINHPDPAQGQLGPFTGPLQAGIVDKHLEDALQKGAKLVAGGKSFVLDGGRYMRPTILTDVTHDMLLMQEETFGPVMPVMRFATADEAVQLANDTQYGLSAAVMAGTEDEALAVAERIDAGNVSVQDAFLTFHAAEAQSDRFGASGVGGARPGLMRYLRRQALLVNRGKPVCLTTQSLNAAG
ncbi:MAG TPA: aldehyde dehydrogenase family protein [Steroidobacteraceae bacterium]|jgi:acyl-CoA reductase-like NAD-dependent aldehyde dehydrogenase|nr:aldehyde dehydrogenase family protein [Steroidobacteraceae bacterium]